MDFSVFSTAPVISAILILFLVGALAGYILGSQLESDKKESALKEANKEKEAALAGLLSDHEENLRVLNKANNSDMEKLKQSHHDEIQQLTEAHLKLVDSLKEGHLQNSAQTNQQHADLIAQLNDTNLNNTKGVQRDYEDRIAKLSKDNSDALAAAKNDHAKEIQTIKSEAENTLEKFSAEHAKAVSLVQDENQKTVQMLERRHQAQIDLMEAEGEAEVKRLTNKISDLKDERSKLQASVAQLEEKIKEDRKNNTFSMSKSGDRLMSVVRSVQELANELETTSKTVTAGEYSVFNELRDNRKQEKILSLGDGDENEETADDEGLIDEDGEEKSEADAEDKT